MMKRKRGVGNLSYFNGSDILADIDEQKIREIEGILTGSRRPTKAQATMIIRIVLAGVSARDRVDECDGEVARLNELLASERDDCRDLLGTVQMQNRNSRSHLDQSERFLQTIEKVVDANVLLMKKGGK